MSKRTLDSFFSPPSKKVKVNLPKLPTSNPSHNQRTKTTGNTPKTVTAEASNDDSEEVTYTAHETYAFPIANLPAHLASAIQDIITTSTSKVINDQPHLDLLYFQPLIYPPDADALFKHLRSTLPFYRVKYTITRFGKPVEINTPRFTTVFGLDETSRFTTTTTIQTKRPPPYPPPLPPAGGGGGGSGDPVSNTTHLTTEIVESRDPSQRVSPAKYKCVPRPVPPSLSLLLHATEALTGETFNFCLVNYYADGNDSISYHSDDEKFLGPNPAIASFTLGARRDFLMKHKPQPPATDGPAIESKPLKLSLGSGDMVLMRGETQSHWLHSIPKRKGGEVDKGRINITMRKAMVPGGTENYYRYNVGEGEVYRWNDKKREMVVVS